VLEREDPETTKPVNPAKAIVETIWTHISVVKEAKDERHSRADDSAADNVPERPRYCSNALTSRALY